MASTITVPDIQELPELPYGAAKRLIAELTAAKADLDSLMGMMLQKRTATITRASLTDAVSGEKQEIAIGAAMPAGAMIVGCQSTLNTVFAGGTISAINYDIGVAGSAGNEQRFTYHQNVFTGQTTGVKAYMTLAGVGVADGVQLVATFNPTGDSLSHLTTGSVTIDVFYFVGF